MSDSKHTPGEWMLIKTPVRGDGRCDFAIHARGERQSREGDTIFTVAAIVPSYEPEKRIWIHDYTQADAEANARLIAAAPELLEALEEILFRFKRVCADYEGKMDPVDEKRIKQAEAAIRKAESL